MDVHGFKDTIEWYDRNAEEYAQKIFAVVPLKSIEEFLTYLPPHPSVLEAGCGPGRESMIFHEKGVEVIGVDLSESLLKIAREKNPEVTFVKANFLELPFEENTFDGVWSHASLVHLETIDDVRRALGEFYRVLKPNGVAYIAVKAQTGDEKTAVVTDALSKHDRFFRYYTSDELTDLLIETGFMIISTGVKEDLHGRPEVRWLEFIARKAH